MSIVFGSFDGKPLISAGDTLAQFHKNEWDDSSFRFKANSFRCPIGEEWGKGWLLMVRSDVQQINTAGLKTLVLGDDSGQVTLPGLIFKSAFRLLPGSSQDPNALYVVEVVDKRFLARQSLVNKRYNLRYPNSASISYVAVTTNSGTPWTWTQIVTDLSAGIPGVNGITIPGTVSATLTSTPENLRYEGDSGWSALCDLANRLGCECQYNPITDTWSMVEMGGATSQDPSSPLDQGGGSNLQYLASLLSDNPTLRTGSDGLIEDAETVIGNYAYPEGVTVCFPVNNANTKSWMDQAAKGYFYSVDVLGSSLTLGTRYTGPSASVVTGTREIIYDAMLALWTSDSTADPDNKVDLTNRAKELAAEWYKGLVDNTNARLVFIGAKGIVPGRTITEVTWREYGDGLKTELMRWRTKSARPEVVRSPLPFAGSSTTGTGRGIGPDPFDCVKTGDNAADLSADCVICTCTANPWVMDPGTITCGEASVGGPRALFFNAADSTADACVWSCVDFACSTSEFTSHYRTFKWVLTVHSDLTATLDLWETTGTDQVLARWETDKFCCECRNCFTAGCPYYFPIPCDGFPAEICLMPARAGDLLTSSSGCCPPGTCKCSTVPKYVRLSVPDNPCISFHDNPDITQFPSVFQFFECVYKYNVGSSPVVTVLLSQRCLDDGSGDVTITLSSSDTGVVATWSMPCSDWDCDGVNVIPFSSGGPCDDVPITVTPVDVLVDENGNPLLDADGNPIEKPYQDECDPAAAPCNCCFLLEGTGDPPEHPYHWAQIGQGDPCDTKCANPLVVELLPNPDDGILGETRCVKI